MEKHLECIDDLREPNREKLTHWAQFYCVQPAPIESIPDLMILLYDSLEKIPNPGESLGKLVDRAVEKLDNQKTAHDIAAITEMALFFTHAGNFGLAALPDEDW